jgi:hypothetical protein
MHTGKKRDPSNVLDAREGNGLDVREDARWAKLDAATGEGPASTHHALDRDHTIAREEDGGA